MPHLMELPAGLSKEIRFVPLGGRLQRCSAMFITAYQEYIITWHTVKLRLHGHMVAHDHLLSLCCWWSRGTARALSGKGDWLHIAMPGLRSVTLGVVLWFSCTGKVPAKGETASESATATATAMATSGAAHYARLPGLHARTHCTTVWAGHKAFASPTRYYTMPPPPFLLVLRDQRTANFSAQK